MSARNLLYVEDEEAAVFLFESTLKDLGTDIQFHRVADGEQALAFLRKDAPYTSAPTPDLVVLDLNLPKVSGLQVLAHIHNDALLGSIPVIIFTSSSLSADRRRSLALGAKEFIIKPASLDRFIQIVKDTCSMVLQ
jgi:CheY-like chemotaxis protein